MATSESPPEMTDDLENELGDEAEDVQEKYERLYNWMITEGKNPRRHKGLNVRTAENYIERLDQLYRFNIRYLEPNDNTKIQDEEADALLRMIDRAEITQKWGKNKDEEYGESTKRKFSNSLESYFKWRYYEGAMEYEWEPKINFSDGRSESAYRFTYRELGLLFEESRTYGSLPSYYDSSEQEREKINRLVAQRLGIPQEDVSRDDWLHADWSRKVYSLVTVAYDAGLTPIEIANAETTWYDPQSKTLRIPSEDACKERDKEIVGLSDETNEALSEWLQERRHLQKYDGAGKIFLNREGNSYQSGSLCKLLRKLCEQAGIKTEDRKIVWYSLRKTMGTNVTDEGELSEANDQLRHERLETTQEDYNQTPVEKLRARLNETRTKAAKAAADPDYNPFEEVIRDTETKRVDVSTQHTPPSDDNNVVTKTQGGDLHVDTTIQDTTEARVNITRKILDDESGQ